MEPQILIILGRPGCGKGTQAKLLQEKFGLEYIGSGVLLREQVKENQTFSAAKLKSVLERGDLVPTFLIFKFWLDKLEAFKNKPDFKGIIFDGSPRKLLEAHLMEDALAWYDWLEFTKAILVDISAEESYARLTQRRMCEKCGQIIPYFGHFKQLTACDKCGGPLIKRTDDDPEVVRHRLDVFETEIQPVIDHYEKNGLLIKIDGNRPIEEVHESIVGALKINK
jgi:adenylate kinase